ncbi:unnamed protein product [Gongylonema pulchrum]|uniref:NAGLU domain-containing protein n=1 Tax=Gongylonema pulchrum TaxID=637853 RepID=A0A183E3F8_9BILA|nr:unnamed protein product [Gongylonema pulchrum]
MSSIRHIGDMTLVFERTPGFTWMVPEYNQRFIDITVKYARTIGWMIFGHHHTDTFHIIKAIYLELAPSIHRFAFTTWMKALASSLMLRNIFVPETFSKSLNATSMNSILEKLKSNDSETWQKYVEYNTVKWGVGLPQGIFRAAQLCSIEYPDLVAYNACMPAGPWPVAAAFERCLKVNR